jgi:di/tricarboxylate transporter
MTVVAHAGHWLVQVAYFAPVLGFLIWLLLTTLRERRRERGDR